MGRPRRGQRCRTAAGNRIGGGGQMTESSRRGIGRGSRGATCARLVAVVVAVACALGVQAAAASASAGRASVLSQRSAGSVSQLVLAPTGLRFSFSAAVRAGGRARAREMKTVVGVITRHNGAPGT